LQQGRYHLANRNTQAAVQVLEEQLPYINGNRAYLELLRDAYRAHIRELRQVKQEDAAKKYWQRLLILDPKATVDGASLYGTVIASTPPAETIKSVIAAPANPAIAAAARSFTTATASTTSTTNPTKPAEIKARGNIDDDKPSRLFSLPKPAARELLTRAEQEFKQKRYREARVLFDQAHTEDKNVTDASHERWAYCKLFEVVEQLNSARPSLTWDDLEREVRSALDLAPKLEYGKKLLGEIQKRRVASEVVVTHYERSPEGWALAETANFRVFHNQDRDVAEQAARTAERTRTAMYQKWFGGDGGAWVPKCDLFLHATGQEYSQATGVATSSPGHSSIRTDVGRVIGRRIDLHCDDPNMLIAVLPHEATHVVLAGQFGDKPVPRWADEGIAVLTEPQEKVERHLKHLPEYYRDGQLFGVRRLMTLNDYPDPRFIGPFYAQSVSLVDCLAKERGPQVFTQFLRDGLQGGYDAALKKHYGISDFEELQRRWERFAVGRSDAAAGVARQAP
jgi:tetratricopeptide (TPR) repeat protein